MYIAPNTTVELFKDLSLDSTYTDTCYFATVADKDNYFTNLSNDYRIGTFNILTFQREQVNFCRVEAAYGTVYKTCYMRFKNTNFANKWFYAFVTSVEYINNEVTQINFELDVMTTWMGEFELLECYVERNHSNTDDAGDNIVPEPFSFNDYVTQDNHWLMNSNLLSPIVIIAYAFSGLEHAQDGVLRDGIFSGLGLKAFRATNLIGINDFIGRFAGKPDSIVAMYMCPANCLEVNIPATGEGVELTSTSSGRHIDYVASRIYNRVTPLDGYVPRNQKLLTYPFNFCNITNNQGTSIIAKYEYANLQIKTRVYMTCLQPVSQLLKLIEYKNSDDGPYETDFPPYFNDSLLLTGFPVCTWTSDAFIAWAMQNAIPYAVQAGSSVLMSTVNPVAGAMNAINTISNILSGTYQAAISPDIVKGNQAPGNVVFSAELMDFGISRMSVNAQVAEQLDKYFDQFGYAYNQWRMPQMASRPYWCYLKTVDCKIHGQIPADDTAKIEKIIDTGIRFWRNPLYIGRYSDFDNSIGAG